MANSKLLLILIINFCSLINGQNNYRAAVVDYFTRYDVSETPSYNIGRNSEDYIKWIKEAKANGAQIIVFPEYGLTSINSWTDFQEILTHTTELPVNLYKNPCTDPETKSMVSVGVRDISCAARNNSITVVINLLERSREGSTSDKEMEKIYSTTVAFSDEGNIVAKYRKFNTYTDFLVNHSKLPELQVFSAFGVKFGIFSTYDIFLDDLKNYNVTDFIFTSSWKNYMPFLSGIAVQAGWARAKGVNLLAAGYQNLTGGYGGSGIYSAKNGINTILSLSNMTQILIQDVNSDYNNKNTENQNARSLPTPLQILKMTLDETGAIFKNVTNEKVTIPINNFKCTFNASLDSNNDFVYKYLAYEGKMTIPETSHSIPVQICALVACENVNCSLGIQEFQNPGTLTLPTINNININGNFAENKKNKLVFPYALTFKMQTLPYQDYKFDKETYSMELPRSLSKQKSLAVFGIIAVTEPNTSINLITPFMLIVIQSLYFIVRNIF